MQVLRLCLGQIPSKVVIWGASIFPASAAPGSSHKKIDVHSNGLHTEEGFREQGGFLDVAGWRKAFEVTGYSEVEIIPDFERIAAEYEEFSIGAVVAKR